MKNYTHIIWDFNGTLVNDGWIGAAINNEMNRKRGKNEITLEYYLDNFTHPPIDFYIKMGYTFEIESYDEVSNEFINLYTKMQDKVKLMDGVKTALETFKNLGFEQLIISAHTQQLLEEHVSLLGISDYFTHIIGSDNRVVTGKVERALAFAKQEGLDFSNAVFIGDTSHDLETAKALGSSCVLVSKGHQSECSLRKQAVDTPIFKDITEALGYIMKG